MNFAHGDDGLVMGAYPLCDSESRAGLRQLGSRGCFKQARVLG
jgi:hypothetical protein